MVGKAVTVELKNDLEIVGTLDSVDQFLNFKLSDIHVVDEEKHPHLVLCLSHFVFIITINAFEQLSVKNAFIRGSVIRYVQVPREAVDTELLQDAARREAMHVAAQRDTTVISSK